MSTQKADTLVFRVFYGLNCFYSNEIISMDTFQIWALNLLSMSVNYITTDTSQD